MVLILSESNDVSTQEVTDWLINYKCKFVRINSDDKVNLISLTLNNTIVDFELKIEKYLTKEIIYLTYKEVTFYWYRRGHIVLDNYSQVVFNTTELGNTLHSYVNQIEQDILYIIYELLHKKPSIGNIFYNRINKLYVLLLAKNVGLKIPSSVIGKKDTIKRILHPLIYKPFDNVAVKLPHAKRSIYSYTELFDNDIEVDYGTSFFQEFINKILDIRVFYLDEEFYCSAIVSQNDEKTKVDFRKYNIEKPNRTIPFSLPDNIKNKLIKLMNSIGLNSGSIDMVVDADGNYFFLEVNPVGQFKQVSYPCRYNLENVIAQYIIKKQEQVYE